MDNPFAIRAASLLFAMMAASSSAADDPVQFQTWTYNEAPMGLYLPPPTGKPLPVVMFLHPCHNDPVYEGLWINAAVNAIEPTAVFLPTAPVTPNTQYSCADWGGTYDVNRRPQMENALHEFDSLVRVHGFDTTRQYLYGESMGGEGVYRLLMDFPARFAGAVSVGGYSVDKGAAQMARTPFWILIGTEDEMSPVADTRTIYQSILDAGGTQVELTELPGLGHVPAIERVRTDSSVVGWLLRQRRAPASGLESGHARSTGPDVVFTIVDGSILWAASLLPETRLAFYGTDGSILFETDTRTKTVRIPTNLRHQVVLWRASHSGGSLSGKMAILP